MDGGAPQAPQDRVALGEEGAVKPEPGCEEIRLAMAMNGGVSLAVWMGGCAAELDRARRAGGKKHSGWGSDPDAKSAYDVLADCFGRRLVIDVLSGTSAGGINAALLGGAMAHGRELDPTFLRQKWIELGDLATILHSPAEESPTALMNGKLFHEKLEETFAEILGGSPPSSAARERAQVPYLDITMTDVLGVERRFRDGWGSELIAREHRPRFKFRRREHFTKATLADAARTSASFPFAFEPWRVADRSRVLAGLPGQTWGIDGGLLDNAPIKDALDLIPSRRASAVVRRYFCYVNADPVVAEEEAARAMPTLGQVGGYAINLPRSAPLVDHLYAIRDAVERPLRTAEAQERLLEMGLEDLERVAGALLPTYAKRRTLESLEEILSDPSDAKAIFEQLTETEGHVPWIPRTWRPGREPGWEWGLRPAQRILHLALDVLRSALDQCGQNGAAEDDAKETRRKLLRTRVAIDSRLAQLREAHEIVTSTEATSDPSRIEDESAAARVNAACREATTRAPEARAAVDAGLTELRDCMAAHPKPFEKTPRQMLFGELTDPSTEICCFVRRALSIEVIRRAFASEADIESAEQLHFIQLTPEAPSPIFSTNPIHLSGPASAEQKLTGVGLGHFAGFFRRSWRANDFMWGRLDASARVVDLLLDSPSPDFGEGSEAGRKDRIEARTRVLVDYLVAGSEEDRWLLKETLSAGGVDVEREGLERGLRNAITKELTALESDAKSEDGSRLPLTRALFQRAVQAEILRAELPVLLAESKKDRELGSGTKPLQLNAEGEQESSASRVKAIRELYSKGSSLPKALTADGEEVSDLGLQTITHASFVGLAALRTAGMPMSKYLGFARPPLLAIAGTVATRWKVRATAALGFWAAALFLTSRFVTEDGDATLDFAAVWSPQTLVALVALTGILGFVLVPGLRTRNGLSPVKNFFYAAGLLASGFLLGAVLASIVGDLSVERLFFAPGAERPPEEVLWAVLVLLGVASFARFPLPKRLQKLRPKLERLQRNGRWTCLLLTAVFVVLSAFTVQSVVGAVADSEWQWSPLPWEGIAALVALVLAPVAAGLAVSLGRRRRA